MYRQTYTRTTPAKVLLSSLWMLVSVNKSEKLTFCRLVALLSLQIGNGRLMPRGHWKMGVLIMFNGCDSTNLVFGKLTSLDD